MKKFILLFFTLLFCIMPVFAQKPLQASISIENKLPPEFFGTWKVVSVQTFCSTPLLSAPLSIDTWNLSRTNNVITLENPQTGAISSVKIDKVEKNTIKFTKTTFSDTEHATETPTITINGENFVGTDKIVIENYKNGKHVSTDTWLFKVKAKKISGDSAQKILK